ncbi:MAG: flagellar motor protein MotB [Bryobacterales bacterium]
MQEDGAGGHGQPPIIIKKVIAGGGHHGGAWKVAYADFVTAMMALFMVLWLMNANQEAKEAVSAYFKDPKGVGDKLGSGQAGSGSGLAVGRDDMQGLAEHIQESMQEMSQFDALKDQVQMTVTALGLRIELLETEQGMFFQSGSATPSAQGNEILALIVEELNKLPNRVVLEGHTDAKPFRGVKTYTNWELAVDRANSARRIMIDNNFPPERIAEVRGFADRQLRFPDQPELPGNRRISLIVMYNDAETANEPGQKAEEAVAAPLHDTASSDDAGRSHDAASALDALPVQGAVPLQDDGSPHEAGPPAAGKSPRGPDPSATAQSSTTKAH